MKQKSQTVIQKISQIKAAKTHNLSLQDLKVFKTIISKLDTRQTLLEDYYLIKYSDLDTAGYTTQNRRQALDESLKKLSSTFIEFETEEEIRVSGLIGNDWIHKKGSSQIQIQVRPHMRDFLLEIKDRYFKYPLFYLNSIKSKYELLLFEHLEALKGNILRTQKIKVDTLKEVLNIPQDKYKNPSTLKREVLDKCIQRINEYSDIRVTLETEKESRKIKYFIFTVSPKDTKESFGDFVKRVKGKTLFYNNTDFKITDITSENYGEIHIHTEKEPENGIIQTGLFKLKSEETARDFIQKNLTEKD